MAEDIGLSPNTAGHLSRIENGAPASIPLALRIEAWSDGCVPADTLLSPADADLLANHRRLSALGRQPQLEPEGCDA